jgi:putative membrane protein
MTIKRRYTLSLALTFLFAGVTAGRARAADVDTADVLKKLHHSNVREIEMGKLAEKSGKSKEVKSFGKMLVQDHTAADKKVTALAKEEKADLGDTSAMKSELKGDMDKMISSDVNFDAKFGQSMLDDHKKDIAEATEAARSTKDQRLKKLLDELIPTLRKHEETAQKIVDSHNKSASR